MLAALGAGLLAASRRLEWYEGLRQPSFALPPVALALLWSGFGLLLAWSFFRMLAAPDWMPDRLSAIRTFGLAVALLASAPLALFGARSPVAGLGAATALVVVAGLCIRRFGQVDRAAGWLVSPFLVWASYVALVCLSLAIRN